MNGNAGANRAVDAWIQALANFDQAVPEMAKEIAKAIPAEVDRAVADQRSLNGTRWKETKSGKPALQKLPAAVTVKAVDTAIKLTLAGVEVWHHFGTKRTPQRQLWDQGPLKGISIGNAIRKGLLKVSKEWLERQGSHRESNAFAGGKAGTPSVDR